MQKANDESVIDNVVRQFLCTVPLKEFNWGLKNPRFSLQDQETILNRTVLSEIVQKHPVPIRYQKVFLKAFLDLLERQVTFVSEEETDCTENYIELHESLYTSYTNLINSHSLTDDCYKHYCIKSSNRIISLKENVNLISEGTTGLRTWQAAIALSEWCIKNKSYLEDKKILELGSGVGLTGLTLALECSPSVVCLTDCHKRVLQSLLDNISLNCLPNLRGSAVLENYLTDEYPAGKSLAVHYLKIGVKILTIYLPWEETDEKTCANLGNFDLILAADIVYDTELFPPLILALKSLCKSCQVKEVIFACTERNEKTMDEFCKVISVDFEMLRLQCPTIDNFIAWDKSTVHLLKLIPKM